MTNVVLTRVPAPNVIDLQQLAQIRTPDGFIDAYWWRDCRKAVVEYHDLWYMMDDCMVVDAVAELVGVKESTIRVVLLTKFDTDNSARDVSDVNELSDLLECTWSDYGTDFMAFQAELDYPEPRD